MLQYIDWLINVLASSSQPALLIAVAIVGLALVMISRYFREWVESGVRIIQTATEGGDQNIAKLVKLSVYIVLVAGNALLAVLLAYVLYWVIMITFHRI